MNYVTFRGNKIPLVNTPLSNAEMQVLREKYDTFLLKDVRLGTVKLINNAIEIKRFRIDFGFRPMVYFTAVVIAFYQYVQVKKKIKNKNPFKWGGEIKDFMQKEVKPNGTKPIEL
jgi:hypothetical protein